jgi:2'-5' RNA ligase
MNFLYKYSEFILEKNRTLLNCIMIKLDLKNWDNITSFINKDDLYKPEDPTFGIQKKPHVTLLYPVYVYKKSEVFKVLDEILDNPISFEILGIDYFKSSYYDVLKFTIKPNDYLNKIHNHLNKNIKNGNKFDFNPHITIAYLKPGSAQKYTNDLRFKIENQNNIVFSVSGGKVEFEYEWKIDI